MLTGNFISLCSGSTRVTSVGVVSGFLVSLCTKCINILVKSLCCMCNLYRYIKHFEMYHIGLLISVVGLPSSVQRGSL